MSTTPQDLESFARRTSGARRVLVVDLGFLGDGVHLIPALWTVREHYAGAEVHLASTPSACAVVGLTQAIDRFWPMELRPGQRSLRAQWRLIRSLRRQRFDVALNLTAADRSVIFMGLSGARHRLALLGGRWHFWNRWIIPHWLPPRAPNLPVFEQFLQALSAAGFRPGPPRFDLRIPESALAWAKAQAPAGGMHVSPCSSSALKEWPVQHYAALIGQLLRRRPGLSVSLSASARPREQERLSALLQRLEGRPVCRLPADLSVPQLAAVLSRCRLHVGPDSGVVHVAMALGIPTVSFFRLRGDGWKGWVPPGPEHRAFLQDCTCLHDRRAPCAASGVPRCLDALPPETVLEACLARLG